MYLNGLKMNFITECIIMTHLWGDEPAAASRSPTLTQTMSSLALNTGVSVVCMSSGR